jgi:hypothetical protein
MSLSWAHGLSPIRTCVVNLSDSRSERFVFISSNTAVIQVSAVPAPVHVVTGSQEKT